MIDNPHLAPGTELGDEYRARLEAIHAVDPMLSRAQYIAAVEKEDPDLALHTLALQVKYGRSMFYAHSGAAPLPSRYAFNQYLNLVVELADLAVASSANDLTDEQVRFLLHSEGLDHVIEDYGPNGQRRMAHIIRRKRQEGR